MTLKGYRTDDLPEVRYPDQEPPPVRSGLRGRCILDDTWVHVSNRTIEGRYAFQSVDDLFTARGWDIIARALKRHDVDIAAWVVLANHSTGS